MVLEDLDKSGKVGILPMPEINGWDLAKNME